MKSEKTEVKPELNGDSQEVRFDDGMCAMACEQVRWIMDNVRKSTGEDKRYLAQKVETVKKAVDCMGKQARGEEVQRVAVVEEEVRKLEEEMRPRSIVE